MHIYIYTYIHIHSYTYMYLNIYSVYLYTIPVNYRPIPHSPPCPTVVVLPCVCVACPSQHTPWPRENPSCDDDTFTPETHLPLPGQRGHSPQRDTAVGTGAPITTGTGNTVPQNVLAFTRYCHNQYCMVYDIQKGGWGWRRILGNRRATVLQKCGQCRGGGGHNMMIDSCTKAFK